MLPISLFVASVLIVLNLFLPAKDNTVVVQCDNGYVKKGDDVYISYGAVIIWKDGRYKIPDGVSCEIK
jgi:hypothetical protein